MSNSSSWTIESDNRTTWVRIDGRTVGRVCPVSAEIIPADKLATVVFLGTPLKTYERFREYVWAYHGIDVPFEAIPTISTAKLRKLRQLAAGEHVK